MKFSYTLAAAVFVAMPLALPVAANTRVQKSFEGWQVDCVETDKAKNCSMAAALVNAKTKQVVISLSVAKGKEGNKLVVRTPNGVLLPGGVSLSFANAKPASIPYLTCGPRACIAETPLSDAWVSALSTDADLKISFSGVNGKAVAQNIPMKGFVAAFEYFQAQTKPAEQ